MFQTPNLKKGVVLLDLELLFYYNILTGAFGSRNTLSQGPKT
jgi:hypothetical protein